MIAQLAGPILLTVSIVLVIDGVSRIIAGYAARRGYLWP